MMGGDITVASEMGKGSTFTICLPAQVDGARDLQIGRLLRPLVRLLLRLLLKLLRLLKLLWRSAPAAAVWRRCSSMAGLPTQNLKVLVS